MPHVMTIEGSGLAGWLAKDYLRKRNVRVTQCSSARRLLRAAAALRPEVVLLAAGSGPGLVRSLRAVLGTQTLFVVGLSEGVEPNDDITSYDDCVWADDPEIDFTRILLGRLGAFRHSSQMRLRLNARIEGPNRQRIEAVACQLDCCSVELLARGVPDGAGPYSIELYRADGRRVSLLGRIDWGDARAPRAARLGVRFVQQSSKAMEALRDLALWEEAGGAIHLHGSLSTLGRLDELAAAIERLLVLDLGDLAPFDAAAARRWVMLFNRISAGTRVRLRRVPAPLLALFRQSPALCRRGEVESFFASHECERCDVDVHQLIEASRPPEMLNGCALCAAEHPSEARIAVGEIGR